MNLEKHLIKSVRFRAWYLAVSEFYLRCLSWNKTISSVFTVPNTNLSPCKKRSLKSSYEGRSHLGWFQKRPNPSSSLKIFSYCNIRLTGLFLVYTKVYTLRRGSVLGCFSRSWPCSFRYVHRNSARFWINFCSSSSPSL